ncbi:hypothetical protein Acr_28g0004610 [Actinidia rufa]|uniref:Retrovirus-related Pol polyprotein from transposon TNT 1-94-like beta-barrel domain-containing protein n=1 Tax=Actinidia rufa TaxID=165716 RepID=A0A7J0H9K3_9ERIC|nr:hypothetical protein Acr_28g0004610 [Actinidia rufa]
MRTGEDPRARTRRKGAATRTGRVPRTLMHREKGRTRGHAPRGVVHAPHAQEERQDHARRRSTSQLRATLALLKVSRHSGFIRGETSAYELWIKVEEMYQVKTSRNKALLMRRLVNLKLQRETTVAEHTSEFQNLVNQLTSVDLQFDNEMQALLLLSSLPESWETLVVSLSNLALNGKLTTSMVMDALFNEEARRREMGSTDQSESQALVLEGSRERGRGQGRGHHKGTGKGRWRSQARDTAATVVMAVDESDVLLAASDNEKSDWVLDSGSAYHLCRDREVFSTYAPCEGRIWMANNTSNRVVGRGSVQFHMVDGRSVTLTEVRHVPNLRKNLISIGMLDSKGCSFNASGGTLRVSKGNKEMLWGKKTGGLYRLEGSLQTGGATVRYGSNSISKENGQGKQPLHKVIVISLVVRTREKRWSHDNSQNDIFCGAPRWKGVRPPSGEVQGTSVRRCRHFGVESYGGAGSEAVRKDNLKISDYPLVG